MENIGGKPEGIEEGSEYVKIADKGALIRRLEAVCDEPDFRRRIYPYLIRIAGEKLPAIAVAGVITMAVDSFTLGDRTGPVSQLVRSFIPLFLDAMIESEFEKDAIKKALRWRPESRE